jgi:hypothetical protein
LKWQFILTQSGTNDLSKPFLIPKKAPGHFLQVVVVGGLEVVFLTPQNAFSDFSAK